MTPSSSSNGGRGDQGLTIYFRRRIFKEKKFKMVNLGNKEVATLVLPQTSFKKGKVRRPFFFNIYLPHRSLRTRLKQSCLLRHRLYWRQTRHRLYWRQTSSKQLCLLRHRSLRTLRLSRLPSYLLKCLYWQRLSRQRLRLLRRINFRNVHLYFKTTSRM